MKTFIDVGYYHPSNANWSYRIVLMVENNQAEMFTSVFGGLSRVVREFESRKEAVKEVYQPYAATFYWSQVKQMRNIEDLLEKGGQK